MKETLPVCDEGNFRFSTMSQSTESFQSQETGDHEPIHVISLGAGVQSSTMALMAAHGEITPIPKCAIFADTGDEPKEVYQWLDELTLLLPFPVHRISNGRLSDHIVNKWDFSQIPAWFRNSEGKASIGRRQCTKYFKVMPIRREIRRLFPNTKVTLWQGISWDEVSRMKDADVQWLTHRWPLIEQRIDRVGCESRLRNFTTTRVPKSACVYCPYRGDKQWKESISKDSDMEIINRVESVLLPRNEFLNRQLLPTSQMTFTNVQITRQSAQIEFWNNECEGMCGV